MEFYSYSKDKLRVFLKEIMKKTYSEILKNEFSEGRLIEKYYDTTPEKISFTSESLFTQKFLKDLNLILNGKDSGKDFRKLTKEKKREKISALEDLLQTETVWRDLIKSSKYNSHKITEIFPHESTQFKFAYKKGFFPKSMDKGPRKSVRGSEKAKAYFTGLLMYIKTNMSYILNEKGKNFQYSEQELNNLVEEIPPIFLFQNFVKISMKKAYDSNVNIESHNPANFYNKHLNSDFLKAKKSDLRYSGIKYINIYLTSHLMNDLATKNKLVEKDIDFIVDILKVFEGIYKTKTALQLEKKGNNWFLLSLDITEILLSMFESTDVIKSKQIEKIKGTNKINQVYIFNHKLDNSIAFSKHLPRIIPPVKAETSESVSEWISPIKKGNFNVQVSKEALAALNNAQRKEFVINNKFLNLLKEVDRSRPETSEFPTKADFAETESKFEAWSDSAWGNILDITFYRTSRSIIRVKKRKSKNLHQKILEICQISHLESFANAAKNESHQELVKKRAKRQLLQTSIEIGELYKDYPLYYGTLLDFRMRMYPLQYLLSRTTGYLKNILEESKKRALTKNGLRNLIEAYYSPHKNVLSKFKLLAPTKKYELLAFYKSNTVNLEKEPLYFELLDSEIKEVFSCKQKKTALQLEIDQVGSGPTLVSLLTRNKTLAKRCNLLDGEFNCIYTFLLGETVKYFESNADLGLEIDKTSSKAFRFLTENRKSQKFALMCFFYNEQHKSRTLRWKEQFEEEFGVEVGEEDFQVFSKFSINYGKFMDSCFPNLSKQLKILNDAMLILIKQGLPSKIETLDGCILSWDFSNTTEIKRSFYNPVSGNHEQVRVHLNGEGPLKQSNTRLNKHRLSFRPNLIHSMDAAIMRLFLQKFYKKTKRRLNHLHDCVMLHPNDVDIFYSIVAEVYCSPAMKTLAEDLFFSRIKKDLVGEPLNVVCELEKQFKRNSDEFEVTETVFNPRKCYRFEGTK